jgi:hypothetical protein
MTTLNLTIRPHQARSRKFIVELDADRFERLAAGLGLFNRQFLASLERAEREIAQGKARRLRSLRDLRRS